MTGILVHLDEPKRAEAVLKAARGGKPFSDTLSSADWGLASSAIALFIVEGDVAQAALFRRGKKVATAKRRVDYLRFVDLGRIPLPDVEKEIKKQLRKYLIRASSGIGGAVPPGTWADTLNAIRRLRPSSADGLDELLRIAQQSAQRLEGRAAGLLIHQRDALGICLDTFSGGSRLRRDVLLEWAPTSEDLEGKGPIAPSILSGIKSRVILEETALKHDLVNWPDYGLVEASDRALFRRGERLLEVFYANRNNLEGTLGVDLIYYNHAYHAFVLVQYKSMVKEGDEDRYRPDSQLRKELDLMESFIQARKDEGMRSDRDMRLLSDGFFVKLVPKRDVELYSWELSPGGYLTREYMEYLVGPNGPTGPQGGRRMTFDDIPRRLSNSEFTALVNRGFIGTRGISTTDLVQLVRSFYENGRALLIGQESCITDAA